MSTDKTEYSVLNYLYICVKHWNQINLADAVIEKYAFVKI